MTEQKHTPLPWEFVLSNSGPAIISGEIGRHTIICSGLSGNRANGHLIVTAVNSHAELVAALEAAVARIQLANAEAPGNSILSAWLPQAHAALAKAKEG
jgi:hypothetical protein